MWLPLTFQDLNCKCREVTVEFKFSNVYQEIGCPVSCVALKVSTVPLTETV